MTADGTPEIFYRQAEHQCTKLARRYFFGWVSIVCFYGMTLMIVPVNDTIHGNMDASNWANLFKSLYVRVAIDIHLSESEISFSLFLPFSLVSDYQSIQAVSCRSSLILHWILVRYLFILPFIRLQVLFISQQRFLYRQWFGI